jgi:hypothetical protein
VTRRVTLEHDPKKWIPVLGKDHAQTNNLERDDDSKRNHRALGHRQSSQSASEVAEALAIVDAAITKAIAASKVRIS